MRASTFGEARSVSKRVLVTGGSVAGNTLAWWLVEGGYEVVVAEQEPEFRDGGQSVDLRGSARTVFERMGLIDKVDASGTGETAWTYVDANGETVAAFRLADIGPDGPTAELEILRGDLARIVFDAVRPKVDYRFGDFVDALEDLGEKVQVRFHTGREESFDLVLVAEGVGSRTRELLFAGENHPRWMDITIGYFTIPRGEGDGMEGRWYNAPGGRVIFLRPDPHGGTKAVLMIREELHEALDLSDEEAKARLAEQFADAGWEAERVIAGLRSAEDLYFEVLRQVKMDRWSRGRVALTGDAAWCATPISGIGTTLAVTGAYVLAGELANHDRHKDAFGAYDRLMRPFVEEGQGTPDSVKTMNYPKTRFGIAIQHAAMAVLSKPVLRDIFIKVGMRESNDIDLPHYQFAKSDRQQTAE